MTKTKNAPTIPLLIGIYGALMILLALTLLAAHADLGPLALLISLAIAAAKAALVILVFMHVKYSSRVTWLFVAAGFLWLTILFSLTFAEYIGRTHHTRAQPLPHHRI